jgi:hypothetical protein
MAFPRSLVRSRYRRLIRKTMTKTMMRSPREPGQRNQPPPLEYPATKHPDSPRVATAAATIAADFVNRVDLGGKLCRLGTSNSSTGSPDTLDHVLDFRNQRADRVGHSLSCYGNQRFPAPVHQIGRHKSGNYCCVYDNFAERTMLHDLFLCRHICPPDTSSSLL